MVIVEFGAITEGKVFKEMVQDLQFLLSTGGILTNAFRPKRKQQSGGTLTDYENQVVFMVDGKEQATEAADFLREQPEVSSVQI